MHTESKVSKVRLSDRIDWQLECLLWRCRWDCLRLLQYHHLHQHHRPPVHYIKSNTAPQSKTHRRSWLIAEDVLFPIGGNISPKLVLTLRWPITTNSLAVCNRKTGKACVFLQTRRGAKIGRKKLLPRSTNGLRISSPSGSVNVPESSKLNLHQSRSNKLLLQEQLIVWFGLHCVSVQSNAVFQCTWLLGKLKIKLIKYTNAKSCAQWCCELPIEETNECEWGNKSGRKRRTHLTLDISHWTRSCQMALQKLKNEKWPVNKVVPSWTELSGPCTKTVSSVQLVSGTNKDGHLLVMMIQFGSMHHN